MSTSTIRPRSNGRWRRASRPTATCVIVPESQGSKLDPSTRNGVGAKMGRRDQAARRRRDGVQANSRSGEENVDVGTPARGYRSLQLARGGEALVLGEADTLPRGGVGEDADRGDGGGRRGRLLRRADGCGRSTTVTFIARGAHRDAIRRDGLKIESTLGDLSSEGRRCHRHPNRSDRSTWSCSP